MISSLGSGMPSMQSLQSMKQQVFSKADTSGNGSLDMAEFTSLVAQAPTGQAPPGMKDPENFFKTADVNGNGQLSETELQDGMGRAMQSLRSTMSMSGGAPGAAGAPKSEQDGWKVLLDSLQKNDRSGVASGLGQTAQTAYLGKASAGLSVSA